jgi:hypothetical protein
MVEGLFFATAMDARVPMPVVRQAAGPLSGPFSCCDGKISHIGLGLAHSLIPR